MSGTIVRDIMTALEGYSAVNDDADLEEAIKVLRRSFYADDKGIVCGHSYVLVMNKAGELTGVLTLQGMLKAIDRKSAELGLPRDGLFSRHSVSAGILAQIPVREAMSRAVKAEISVDDDTGRAIRILLESETDILPVIGQGRVVGIVRAIDLLRSVTPVSGEKQEVILSFLTVS